MAKVTPNAYFEALGEGRYLPTEHAGGAWRDDELHLAPVAGLVIHHMEQWREKHHGDSMVFSRFTVEALGQIMREQISLSTEVIRPGRTIELIETTAVIAGRAALRVRGWLLQASDTSSVAGNTLAPMPGPDGLENHTALHSWPGGFIRSLTARVVEPATAGRGRAWLTSSLQIVEGEPSTPLAHFCRLIDAANGIAIREQPTEWMYPNVDLTIHLFAQPRGEWMGLDTHVSFGATGQGLTSSVLHDREGPVGAVQQSLTVRRIPKP